MLSNFHSNFLRSNRPKALTSDLPPLCSANDTEYVAAQEFLDEEHEGPECVSPNDNNDYTLGRLGKHNVVMAVLPDGEYGTASAASVATNMLHSFPNVRIGLMVGIGGGAPSEKHDIRLGDIVVSAPRDREGGVFQYDFGKTIQGQKFQEIRFLNQPPTLLRTAVSGLQTQYERKGHLLEEAINGILEKNSRLRRKYKRPEPNTDRLYQSTVTHPLDNSSSCATVCGDDPSNLILRPERTEDEDNTTIHYGLIASANQLMKDALVRDKLTEEKDVLCFEMEAAGLMNHFPCLVIRGVCDYSDSHKNKEWQGYAAMAAAAYAKNLLCRIPPNRVEAEKKIGEILSDVRDEIGKLLHIQHNEEHKTILQWLTLVEYASQQNDTISRRQKGTGQWLLNSEIFRDWLNQSNQTLFCPGIPGAGKTMSAAIVIDELFSRFRNDASIGVAYFYCNFRRQHEQKPVDLFTILLKQLIQGLPSMPQHIQKLYERHQPNHTRPSSGEISEALQSVIHDYSKIFIIVDALDECQISDGAYKQLLAELFNLQTKTAANLFVTSRFIPRIEKEFDGKSTRLEIRASNDDLQRYFDGHMLKLPSFVSRNAVLQREIKTAIIKAVDGIFLLAQLHFDSLIGKQSSKTIKNALKELPKGSEAYDQAYREAMKRIEGQVTDSKTFAKQILSWIIGAKRPLTILELQHALAVEIGEPELDNENLSEIEDIVSVCAGLVTIDNESNIIRLIHYTTQEFFERTRKEWFPKAEIEIAGVCITYLSFDVFGSGFCKSNKEFMTRLQYNPLYDYAARNWGHHIRESDATCPDIEFFKNEAKVSASSQALMVSSKYRWGDYSYKVPRRMERIHLMAWFGLAEMLGMLLEDGHDSDCKDSHNRTPLSYAAQNGHEAVVKLLLARADVDVNSKDKWNGKTPLLYAAESGHEAVTKLLLARADVDVNSKSEWGKTPLLYAAESGHEMVIKLLLARTDVDVNLKDNGRQTPLSYAAQNGHEAVIKLLLARADVDVNSKSKWGKTPLLHAAESGHKVVVKLLLARTDVDVNLKDNGGKTPLSYAAQNGHETVIKLLLARADVDVNSKDNWGQTPLSYAAESGHEAVVKLLESKNSP